MVKDCAVGMAYLHDHKIIHRDLAARNLLIEHLCSESDFRIKIGDFGMSRHLSDSNPTYIPLGRSCVAWGWAAPEIFEKVQFSFKSDIWSFGVVVWEIFTYCKKTPYQDDDRITNHNLMFHLQNNKRLSLENASIQIKKIVEICWLLDPTLRGTFHDVCKMLEIDFGKK